MFSTLMSLTSRKPAYLLAIICIAEVLSMMSFAAWPVYLVRLKADWLLSNYQAGWISGAYFIGYVCATPFLVGLTDRIDARGIYLFSAFLGGLGCLCFAFFARDFWTACFSWALVGAGLAGTYMPGLQILNSRLDTNTRLRLLPYYTSSFGIGTSLSFLVMGWLLSFADAYIAFIISALASFLGMVAIGLFISSKPVKQQSELPLRHPLDFRPAFRNQRALFYIFSYGAHNYELFAFRSWLFAFLLFAGGQHSSGLSPTQISILVSVLAMMGMAASVIGAEFCMRHGRAHMVRLFSALTVFASAIASFKKFLFIFLIVFVEYDYLES